jgi:2-octaprenyl-6-methoxyphenol hydroxylase
MALAELICDAAEAAEDPGDAAILQRYSGWRRADQRNVSAFTDALARVFTYTGPVAGAARSLGLLAVDLLPPIKRGLAAATMGRGGGLPRILRDAR